MLICAILKLLSIARPLVSLLFFPFRLLPSSYSATHLLYYHLSTQFRYLFVAFICLRSIMDVFVIFIYYLFI